ncbi:o-succinylbenzoate synthase [Marininema halotolerans]|uniref:o-succinylbenzoate synthase n=1 Tax=Marininema halotolerans TaxID=1155944 RepID=A0A1I6PLZ9_9BACL|nr:o-succinylbenzoate synthase [Marininema halotolerans]SFS41243.1 O-succinylbenzoate synthase [Marininema halotolerans]
MNIQAITFHHLGMRLTTPFVNSLTTIQDREVILIEMIDEEGVTGWGECVAFSSPWYTEETCGTAWHVMGEFLAPRLLKESIYHPEEVNERFSMVRRNPMAKAALEGAVWDLWAKREGKSLSVALGGVKEAVAAGVAVGAQESIPHMIEAVRERVEQGYPRVKVKIKPGADVEVLEPLRNAFPDLSLMADANAAYTLRDIERLKALDEFQLLMIEQPLAVDDIIDHAKLQEKIRTPICLDESITSFEDARQALELGSCQVINVKLGRVGGIVEALHIHELAVQKKIPLWCGGMLETGVSRSQHIALASLPGFTLPGDLSASSRYWKRDVITPPTVVKNGQIHVPTEPGIGVAIDRDQLQAVRIKSQTVVAG